MDVRKVLSELHAELRQIEAAILALERLQTGVRRRGRPPAWLATVQKRAPARLAARKNAARRSAASGS